MVRSEACATRTGKFSWKYPDPSSFGEEERFLTQPNGGIAQNKLRSPSGEGCPRRPVSHDWRAATRQLLNTADTPVLQHKPIFSPRTGRDRKTALPGCRN